MSTLGPLAAAILGFGFFVALFVGIFALVGRITASKIRELEPEGIERRSGSRRIRTTLRNFRSPQRMSGHKMSINYGELVLLRDAFVVVAGLLLVRFANTDLGAAEVSVDGDRLYFKSSKPQGATGSVEVSVALPDAETWRDLLAARGAQPHAG